MQVDLLLYKLRALFASDQDSLDQRGAFVRVEFFSDPALLAYCTAARSNVLGLGFLYFVSVQAMHKITSRKERDHRALNILLSF
jgi:hypothetical protein